MSVKSNFPMPELAVISENNIDQLQKIQIFSYGQFRSMAVSPDEKIIAITSSRGVWLFRRDALQELPIWLTNDSPDTFETVFTEDGNYLIARNSKDITVWDLHSHDIHQQINFDDMSISKLAILNQKLFVGFNKGIVRVYDINDWKVENEFSIPLGIAFSEFFEFREEDSEIIAIALSHNKELLAIASRKVVSIYRTNSLQLISRFECNIGSEIKDLCFSSDDLTLGVVTQARSYHRFVSYNFYNVSTGHQADSVMARTIDGTPYYENDIWHINENIYKYFMSLNNTEDDTKIEFLTHHSTYRLSDEQIIQVSNSVSNCVEEWDIVQGERLQKSTAWFDIAYDITFSKDSELILQGYKGWKIQDGTPISYTKNISQSGYWSTDINASFVSTNRPILAGVDESRHFKIYDLEQAKMLRRISIKLDDRGLLPPDNFLMLPDWQYMISGSQDVGYGLYLWDLETGKNKLIWKNGDDSSEAYDISDDGKYLVAITKERGDYTVYRVVRVFDLATFEEIFTYEPGFKATFVLGEPILFISTRPPRKKGRIEIWDFINNKQLGIVPEMSPYQDPVSFSSDNQLAFIPHEKTFEVWNWRQQKMIRRMQITDMPDSYINKARLSPDGKIYATIVSKTQELIIWGIPIT